MLVVDTGGMKGRGEEPTREEVLEEVKGCLPMARLASEYGMTEMLSQGYAKDGLHHTFPKWVSPLVRDPRDPRCTLPEGRMGRLDVVDLANVHLVDDRYGGVWATVRDSPNRLGSPPRKEKLRREGLDDDYLDDETPAPDQLERMATIETDLVLEAIAGAEDD